MDFSLPRERDVRGFAGAWRRSVYEKGLTALQWDVRYWLLADIQAHSELCPLYPRKRTF